MNHGQNKKIIVQLSGLLDETVLPSALIDFEA